MTQKLEVHRGDDYTVIIPEGAHTSECVARVYHDEEDNIADVMAAAPELQRFAEQIFSGLDTGMIKIETPADETLANVLKAGRDALTKAKGAH